jgi:SAM-dependent methyltransferase
MPMVDAHPNPNEQAALWNGPAGRAWVDAQELLDATLKPFEELLVEAVATRHDVGECRVLDVGCGTGVTTLAVARRLGANSRCTGIDISEPMIATARTRAAREGSPASFVLADAQEHVFAPAGFDVIMSRFGVMFFDDPVRAFANLRHAARADAELVFLAWRAPEENPFMTTAERAAAPLLPGIPPRRHNAPGQFAFADDGRVRRILAESGWGAVDISPVDIVCTLPETALVGYLTRLGPLGLALREADAPTRERVIKTVRAAFDPFVDGAVVRFATASWMVAARAAAPAAHG